jgi:hypothetical protein
MQYIREPASRHCRDVLIAVHQTNSTHSVPKFCGRPIHLSFPVVDVLRASRLTWTATPRMSLQITTAVLAGLIFGSLLYVECWLLLRQCPCTYLGCNRSVLGMLRRIALALGQQPLKKARGVVIAGQDGQSCGERLAIGHYYCGKQRALDRRHSGASQLIIISNGASKLPGASRDLSIKMLVPMARLCTF